MRSVGQRDGKVSLRKETLKHIISLLCFTILTFYIHTDKKVSHACRVSCSDNCAVLVSQSARLPPDPAHCGSAHQRHAPHQTLCRARPIKDILRLTR